MEKIRSQFILKKIFKNLCRKKYLQIIKYNKKIQKKGDISLIEYKEYNQIEIILKYDLSLKEKYINIIENNKPYIHIYNIKQNEIHVGIMNHSIIYKISEIKIIIDNEVKSLKGLFKNCVSIIYINFIKCNRKDIISTSELFFGCDRLIKLNINNLKTDKVTDTSYMFFNCSALKDINLSNLNFSNVTDMQNMFEKCIELKLLNLPNCNSKNLKFMNNMFSECTSLKKLNLNIINTTNLRYTNYMFYKCLSLEEINNLNFDTSNVIDMSYMFSDCENLKELNLSNFNTSNVINMSNMFRGCYKLINLDISNFRINNYTTINNMFSNCDDSIKQMVKNKFKDINNSAFECYIEYEYFEDSFFNIHKNIKDNDGFFLSLIRDKEMDIDFYENYLKYKNVVLNNLTFKHNEFYKILVNNIK